MRSRHAHGASLPIPRRVSRLRAPAAAALLVLLIGGLLPTSVFAAAPVALDDPSADCGNGEFGGAFPIPEDWSGGFPEGYEDWFAIASPCDLLHNDTDADGDVLTYEFFTDPAHGDVVYLTDDTFAYRPDPDFSTLAGDQAGGSWASDSFTYRAFDGTEHSNPATFTVWVSAINDPPSFSPGDDVIVDEDSGPYSNPWATNIAAGPPNESDQAVTFEITDIDTGGIAGLFAELPAIDGDGVLTFTPGADKVGLATVTVRAVDDGGLEDYDLPPGDMDPPDDTSDTTTFAIVVEPVEDPPNGAPNAGNDTASMPEGAGPTAVNVLANDSDPDGDGLEITAKTNGTHGTVAITGGGAGLTYDPAQLYHGTDTFTYTVSDGHGGTGMASVQVTVTPDVTPPTLTGLTQGLPGQTIGTSTVRLRLEWNGTDTGSGVESFRLQMSKDGGAYATVSLASPTATDHVSTVSVGHTYRFRVRATDREGNVSNYKSWPTLTPGRHQETTSLATYTGTWSTSTNANMSGGGSRHTTSASKRVRLSFNGRDAGWVATRTASGGHAAVYADGVLVATIDLHATSTQYRKLVFRHHFSAYGAHTIEIRPTGDGRVDFDALIVLR